MKRYSTLLLLACWLVLLYVVSTITFATLESVKSDSPKSLTSQNSQILHKPGGNF
ncbi:hypothetical protein Oweho_3291 [Owenweeksia hongkongensis DSM 17368]|uniref:Uncharacterized protein n=1 Tax=Owenweeksia hongkongensis (strain DSM 17368 / CIP 108786 / JCM 12287 / NRRL B-23963 / UST20020801) TaxID=926562 RepID=G8R4E2_OWEHD|nr:hypothetical protein Oweho_3291 [Owenweeksia hongkongensis DSM 17368]